MERRSGFIDMLMGLVVVAMAVIMVTLVGTAIVDGVAASKFDKAYEAGTFVVTGSLIELGGEGQPSAEEFDIGKVPARSKASDTVTLDYAPRRYVATGGCAAYNLPKDTTGVRAAVIAGAGFVKIYVPPNAAGSVLLCGTPGLEVEVAMWVVKAK